MKNENSIPEKPCNKHGVNGSYYDAVKWVQIKNIVLIIGTVAGIIMTGSFWFLILMVFYTMVDDTGK